MHKVPEPHPLQYESLPHTCPPPGPSSGTPAALLAPSSLVKPCPLLSCCLQGGQSYQMGGRLHRLSGGGTADEGKGGAMLIPKLPHLPGI
jgi:hypothetical protein